MAIGDERVVQPSPLFGGLRISWGGIWGGFLVVMGSLILLATLGLAIGVTAIDVGRDGTDPGAAGTGAAWWGALSLLLALFLGGLAASRLGMVVDRTNAMMQGALTWVLAMLAVIWLALSGLTLVAGATMGIVGSATQAVAGAAGQVDFAELASGNPEQVLERLEQPQTVRMIAAATGTSELRVRSQIQEIRQNVERVRENPAQATAELRRGIERLAAQAGQRVEQAAERAQPAVALGSWMTFFAMLLSLAAAVGGGVLGGRQSAARAGLPSEAMSPPPRRG